MWFLLSTWDGHDTVCWTFLPKSFQDSAFPVKWGRSIVWCHKTVVCLDLKLKMSFIQIVLYWHVPMTRWNIARMDGAMFPNRSQTSEWSRPNPRGNRLPSSPITRPPLQNYPLLIAFWCAHLCSKNTVCQTTRQNAKQHGGSACGTALVILATNRWR